MPSEQKVTEKLNNLKSKVRLLQKCTERYEFFYFFDIEKKLLLD